MMNVRRTEVNQRSVPALAAERCDNHEEQFLGHWLNDDLPWALFELHVGDGEIRLEQTNLVAGGRENRLWVSGSAQHQMPSSGEAFTGRAGAYFWRRDGYSCICGSSPTLPYLLSRTIPITSRTLLPD
jgi:hypothetical protein